MIVKYSLTLFNRDPFGEIVRLIILIRAGAEIGLWSYPCYKFCGACYSFL
jgi:hypothetical protein